MAKNVPSYVLSDKATTQKQERADRDMIMELRRQREHEEQRAKDLTKNNLSLRTLAERKSKVRRSTSCWMSNNYLPLLSLLFFH
jgi:hypothetical protein